MRFDGAGGELRQLDLIHSFFVDWLFVRERKRKRTGLGVSVSLRIGEAAIQVFSRDRRELRAIGRDQRDFHVGEGDGLSAVVGHDKEDREKTVLSEVDGEEFGFVRRVVGIGGDCNLIVGMAVVCRIGTSRLGNRFFKSLGCEQQRQKQSQAKCASYQVESVSRRRHKPDYKGERSYRRWTGLEWLSLSYFLYSLALGVGMLLSWPYWLYQMLRHGKYRTGLAERMGKVPRRLIAPKNDGRQRVIWVHAVSVGEVQAVSRLVDEMRQAFQDFRVVVSTTTDTGQALARKRFGDENVFYFPMDFAFAIRPYLLTLKPELVVLAETEFWPNLLRLTQASGARIAVVNARISDRSWPNYRRFRRALRRVLTNVDLFLAQTPQDSERLQSIGAEAKRVQVTGNLKFDLSTPAVPAIVQSLRRSLAAEGAGPILVCGSTVEDEEPVLLRAFENVRVEHPRAVMLLAPRHPERFDEVASLLQQLGIRSYRRSHWAGEPLAGGVLLVDSIGELSALYALADVAFVGGSLVPRGGHNIIEPALHGVAIVTGNHTENFRDIVKLFHDRDAVRIVGLAELPLTLMHLLANDSERHALRRRAEETARSQLGATKKTLDALKTLLAEGSDRRPLPAQAAYTD